MYTKEETSIANKTCRTNGTIGANAIIPRCIPKLCKKTDRILDYGAGKDCLHAKALGYIGYIVDAHEFGDNFVDGRHTPNALSNKYDVVYMSNVLNVQSSIQMLQRTMQEVMGVLEPGGFVVANYPKSPRKAELSDKELLALLETFGTVEKVKMKYNALLVTIRSTT